MSDPWHHWKRMGYQSIRDLGNGLLAGITLLTFGRARIHVWHQDDFINVLDSW